MHGLPRSPLGSPPPAPRRGPAEDVTSANLWVKPETAKQVVGDIDASCRRVKGEEGIDS